MDINIDMSLSTPKKVSESSHALASKNKNDVMDGTQDGVPENLSKNRKSKGEGESFTDFDVDMSLATPKKVNENSGAVASKNKNDVMDGSSDTCLEVLSKKRKSKDRDNSFKDFDPAMSLSTQKKVAKTKKKLFSHYPRAKNETNQDENQDENPRTKHEDILLRAKLCAHELEKLRDEMYLVSVENAVLLDTLAMVSEF